MKIIEVIAGFGAGGAETLLKDLSIEMKKNNHEVTVVVMNDFTQDITERSKIKQLQEQGIEVISLKRKPGSKTPFLFFKIFRLLRDKKPTLVHIHSSLAAIYFFPFAYMFKAQFVQTIHNTRITAGRFQKIFYAKLFPLKYKNVYCSEEAHNSLSEIVGDGIVINNGITAQSNKNLRAVIEKEYDIPKGSFVALTVGRMVEAKNQLVLIDLVEKLNDKLYNGTFYLLLCGKHYDDALYEKLTCESNQLKFRDNIKFIGVKDNIPDLMYSSDLYISSSIHEGLPITVLEAMNTGVPIVLSPIKEHLNIFNDLESCYFPEENMVSSYVSLFKNNQNSFAVNKEDIINKRNSLIREYNIEAAVSNYLNFFESVLTVDKKIG